MWNAADRFLELLSGVTDPEKKRKIIGETFIRVFEAEAKNHGPFQFLVQGTLYPDVIESGGDEGGDEIKTHHNVGGLPRTDEFDGSSSRCGISSRTRSGRWASSWACRSAIV